MSHWNHRVVKIERPSGVEYSIRDVFYNEDGSIDFCSAHPSMLYGESLEELRKTFQRCFNCLGFPVIELTSEQVQQWFQYETS